MRSLQSFFKDSDHHPSADHLLALRRIAETMQDMATAVCPPKVFLSACDPGIGKSQTVIHFARTLTASPEHADVGMLVCVGRLSEAKAIAEALNMSPTKFALLTSDDALNALGWCRPEQAQVLITTQQRIERVTEHVSFSDASAFWFLGEPRRVRVWDEAWLPGVAVLLAKDDLLFLPKLIRPVSPACADALIAFAAGLGNVKDGELVSVPDLEALYGVSLHDILADTIRAVGCVRDDQQAAATALLTLNGRTARVCRDGRSGATILSYRNTLPNDLKPLLVLDASGRVRETYRHIERYRGDLERLPEAVKDYSPLTVHTWRIAGSKTGFQKQGDVLAKAIADTIALHPDDPWLVVAHKPGGTVGNPENAIRKHLRPGVGSKAAFITWGNHMASNAFSETPRVILAGTLFMAQSFYTALTHLGQNRDVGDGLASAEDVRQTMRGEHANLVLQAICRGRVRKSDGIKCLPMEAYIIASQRSGIPDDLARVFPGCRVVPWKPVAKALRGNAKQAFDHVRKLSKAGAAWIGYGEIAQALGVDRKNFGKALRDADGWPAAIRELGFELATGERGAKGVRRRDLTLSPSDARRHAEPDYRAG